MFSSKEFSSQELDQRTYQHGPAGHMTQIDSAGNVTDLAYDDAGRLSQLLKPATGDKTDFLYDGRSYLVSSEAGVVDGLFNDDFELGLLDCWDSKEESGVVTVFGQDCQTLLTVPTYSSEGVLHSLDRFNGRNGVDEVQHFLYFAGRPAAQVTLPNAGGVVYEWITTDHLGTPAVVTDAAGVEVWSGGFEPFGRDFSMAASTSLRLPGQWEDGSWSQNEAGMLVYQNVHRWYSPFISKYSRADSLGLYGDVNLLGYSRSNPVQYFDSLGLAVQVCCKKIPYTLGRVHCYIKIIKIIKSNGPRGISTWGLHPPYQDRDFRGGRRAFRCSQSDVVGYVESNDSFDLSERYPDAECGPVDEDPCGNKERCVDEQALAYPQSSKYCLFGPNSNTFAATLTNACGLTPPSIARKRRAPGWEDQTPTGGLWYE